MKTSIERAYVFADEGGTTTRLPRGRPPEDFEESEVGLVYAGGTYLILRDNGDYLCESTVKENAEFLVKALEYVDERIILKELAVKPSWMNQELNPCSSLSTN